MDGGALIGLGTVIFFLLNRKKGKVEILDVQQNGRRVKYKLSYGSMFVQEWIFLGDNTQVFEDNGYLFIVGFTPDGLAISFQVYKKGSPDKLVYMTAYTINNKQ